MAVDFLAGFEHGLPSQNGGGLFDAVSGSSMDTTPVRTGTYSFGVATTGGAYLVRKNHSARNHLVVRGYVYINSLPGSGTRGQIHSTLVGTSYGNIQIDSSGVLYASYRTSGGVLEGSEATGPTLSTGQWYRLDIHYDLSGSPNIIHWQVDGSTQTDASYTNAARTCTNSNWGQVQTTATYDFNVDDWIQGDASGDYPFGAGHVAFITAGSDGTHSFTDNDFSTGETGTQRASSYTDFYLMVDDARPWTTTRSTTDSIAQRVARTTGYVEVNPADAPEAGTANAVRMFIGWASSATQANTAACIVRTSAGFANVIYGDLPVAQGGGGGALADYSVTTINFSGVIVTEPAGGWTQSEINQLHIRFGGSDDVSPIPSIQQLGVEIDYPDEVAYAPRYAFTNFQGPGVF